MAGFPGNYSHVLQPLDILVFGPLKEEFRKLRSLMVINVQHDDRKDIFTICELLCDAYHSAINPANAIAEFRRTGISCHEKQGVKFDKIKPTDLTSGVISDVMNSSLPSKLSMTSIFNSVIEEGPHARTENKRHLFNSFMQRADQLSSDGKVVGNGKVKAVTTSGASLTTESMINTLRQSAEHKIFSVVNVQRRKNSVSNGPHSAPPRRRRCREMGGAI